MIGSPGLARACLPARLRRLRTLALSSIAACLGMPAEADEARRDPLRDRLYFFTGMDVARDNAYGWAGTAWAPFTRMDEEGPRLRTKTGGGRYLYRTSAVPGGWNGANKLEGELLAGWQWLRGPHALAVYVGANVVDNALDRADPANRDQGTQFGAKFVAEWFHRYDEDWTFTAALGASTADETATIRATAARRVHPWFELGLEASASTDWLSRDARGGLFVATPLPGWQLRAAGGWRWSSDSDDGAYGTLSLYAPY